MDRSDLKRLDEEYRRRSADQGAATLWSAENPVVAKMLVERIALVFDSLRHAGVDFASARVLDVGCGGGYDLNRFAAAGFTPTNLFGIDYVEDRMRIAHRTFPALGFARADGSRLPFRDGQFDVVSQFTAFSAIADAGLKSAMAAEMWRVLRPGGHVLWYDMRPLGANASRAARAAHAIDRNLVSPGALLAKAKRKLAARNNESPAGALAAAGTTVVPIDAVELKTLFPGAKVAPMGVGMHFAIAALALHFGDVAYRLAGKLPNHSTHWFALIRK